MLPDWKLPEGVDRGLWDYMNSETMVAGYDAQMAASALARADVAFCQEQFQPQGRSLDLGCGTGRLSIHLAKNGHNCVGVDLSELMLAQARRNASDNGVSVEWIHANLLDFPQHVQGAFDNVACLFSTLGMVRGTMQREQVIGNVAQLLTPGGCFVLHVHNRWFNGLGWRRFVRSDHTMPQAYGGAPLTLHHFSKREMVQLLKKHGFEVDTILSLDVHGSATPWPHLCYGYLVSARL